MDYLFYYVFSKSETDADLTSSVNLIILEMFFALFLIKQK